VAKGGTSRLIDVYDFAERVTSPGFVFMNTPGYDPVSPHWLGGGRLYPAGVHHLAGGSAIGFPTVPVIKISSNSPMYRRNDGQHGHQRRSDRPMAKRPCRRWAARFFDFVLEVASGRRTCAERLGTPGNLCRGGSARSCKKIQ